MLYVVLFPALVINTVRSVDYGSFQSTSLAPSSFQHNVDIWTRTAGIAGNGVRNLRGVCRTTHRGVEQANNHEEAWMINSFGQLFDQNDIVLGTLRRVPTLDAVTVTPDWIRSKFPDGNDVDPLQHAIWKGVELESGNAFLVFMLQDRDRIGSNDRAMIKTVIIAAIFDRSDPGNVAVTGVIREWSVQRVIPKIPPLAVIVTNTEVVHPDLTAPEIQRLLVYGDVSFQETWWFLEETHERLRRFRQSKLNARRNVLQLKGFYFFASMLFAALPAWFLVKHPEQLMAHPDQLAFFVPFLSFAIMFCYLFLFW